MSGALDGLDFAAILAYLAGTVLIGLWVGRRVRGGADFFLAGRRLPWWAIGFSLVATDIGATDLIGGGGNAYEFGLAVANFEWIGCVPAMIVAAFVFIPFFHRAGVYTIPEYMERRYNGSVRGLLAVCLLVFMACNLGIMLFAAAKMMVGMVGLQVVHWVVIVAVVVGIYTWSGGLAAVVYTDVLQCVVMIGGCLLMGAIGLGEVGGAGALWEKVQALDRAAGGGANHTALILPADTPTPWPWSGVLFGLAFVLSPAYWIGNQAILQRSLGARSASEAGASYMAGALLKTLIPLIYVVPGLVALVLIPGAAHQNDALPSLAARILPAGVRGLFVAAFLAALMSSVDSYLNSAAAIFTRDLYLRFLRPGTSATEENDPRLLRVGRVTTLALMVVGVGVGVGLDRMEGSDLYSIFQTLMSFFNGPLLAILLAGLFWRRATAAGALAGFVGGVLTAVGLFVMNLNSVCAWLGVARLFEISEAYLYFSIWAFGVAAALLVGVSLATRPAPPEKLSGAML
jgi:SSS family solute:Na+ symporter